MKLFGHAIAGPNVEHLVLPRKEYDIVITAQAILDDKPFDLLCPKPKPPKAQRPGVNGSNWSDDLTDEHFLKAVNRYSEQRTAWTILQSLSATPKEMMEWETVKLEDPGTWTKWQNELKSAYFTDSEIIAIMQLVWSVNGMSQEKLDEARKRFLAGLARVYNPPLSPKEEPPITPSGEPVKDSESVPQA